MLNIDQEIARLNIEIQKNPDNETAKKSKAILLNNKALQLSNKNQNDEALKIIKQAISLNPSYAAFYCNQAIFYSKSNRYLDAICTVKKALELEPDNTNAIEILSVNLNNQFTLDSIKGNDQEALKNINKALELKPNDKIYLYNKASILNKLSRYQEANEVIDKALEIDSNDFNCKLMKSIIYNQLSLVDSDNGNYEEALNKINYAIEFKSNEIGHYINKATYLINLNRIDEAVKCVDKAFTLDKNSKEAKRLKEVIHKMTKK